MEGQKQNNPFIKFIKPMIPLGLRIRLRKFHQGKVFRKAIIAFQHNYVEIEKHPAIINDLIYGWGNMGWSSFQDYTLAIILKAKSTNGPVLECGSGLSTILLGIIAEQKGFDVYTLEHHTSWANHVKKHLHALNLTRVRVHAAPLKRYEGFCWYDVAALKSSIPFTLVVCDGPPLYSDRYGLIPIMQDLLANNAVILFDDYRIPEEKLIVEKWGKEFNIDIKEMGENDPYADIVYYKTK